MYIELIDKFLQKKETTIKNIIEVYKNFNYDWMVGFSGGKDSNVLVQIIIESLLQIDPKDHINKIYIVSSDTMIENPIVLNQLNNSLRLLTEYVAAHNLPVEIKKVKPNIDDTFWVNLIGRGYPLPNQTFRWCTDRLKIQPMNKYLDEIQKEEKKEILTVTGVRMGESLSRDIKLKKTKIDESYFRTNKTNGKYMYSPIEEFTLFDIWSYLQKSNIFFGENNMKLSILYEDSSTGTQECPSSLDDKLVKGCGSSRWGCWLCPVVTKDKSLQGFINSGQEWLKPLLDFREQLVLERDDRKNRFKASIRISKSKEDITLVKYRLQKLRIKKDGLTYFLPKKSGRDEIIFGKRSIKNNYLIINDSKKEIISESQYRKFVDDSYINPYSQNELYDYVIEKETDDDLYIIGIGPYTIDYRRKIFKQLLNLNEKFKEKFEIISEQEIQMIINILSRVENKLRAENFLSTERLMNYEYRKDG